MSAIFVPGLPSLRLSPKLSLKLSLKVVWPLKICDLRDKKLCLRLSLKCPRGEGNWAARQGQKLSRGNFYPAATRCLTGRSGRGKLFCSQLEFCCLQLSFFAYSPLRHFFDALSHLQATKKLQLQVKFLQLRLFSQPQSSTQKGVHAHPLTAREREHWFLKHLSHSLAANFGRQ